MTTTNEPKQSQLQQEATTLSRVRIAEQVITNVLSALAIGALAAIGSLLLLLYQRIANYVVVPTHVLMAIVFFGLGALIMLVLVAVGAYVGIGVAIRRSNAIALAALGAVVGYAIGLSIKSGTFGALFRNAANKTAATGTDTHSTTPTPTSTPAATDDGVDLFAQITHDPPSPTD